MRLYSALRAGAVVAAATLLAGCSGQDTSSGGEQAVEGTDATLSSFYEQEVTWGDCEDVGNGTDIECADVTVPVDYAEPDAETTTVVMARVKSSSDDPRGSLIMNPGGPGGSGVDLLQAAGAYFDDSLSQEYDLVSFDPRGVFRSDGIQCLDDAELDEWREEAAFDPEGEPAEQIRQEYRTVGEACQDKSGPVFKHMDTESAARDMDVMRAVLGDTQMTYLGFSYGTQLGSTYAQLFPDRVGRFVLDGAVDPSADTTDVALAQVGSFEESLREFVRDCTETNNMCFTDGSVEDGMAEIQRILAGTEDGDVTTEDGRTVSTVSAVEGVLIPLYSPTTYGTLNQALREAQDGDYSGLLALSDTNHGRTPDGSYRGNSTFAFSAVNCLDLDSRDVTDQEMSAAQDELTQQAPTFGRYLGYTEAACQEWPVEPRHSPEPVEYDGDAQILVIGTTHDPATPYHWAEALTEQLGNARMLTYDGWGHGAYTSGSSCVVSAVNTYLLEGTLPPEGEVCSGQ